MDYVFECIWLLGVDTDGWKSDYRYFLLHTVGLSLFARNLLEQEDFLCGLSSSTIWFMFCTEDLSSSRFNGSMGSCPVAAMLGYLNPPDQEFLQMGGEHLYIRNVPNIISTT